MSRIKKVKSQNRYPNELKRKIAQEYLSGRFSYAVAAEEYGLKDKSVVKEFVKWFRRNADLESAKLTIPMSKKSTPSTVSSNEALEKRIKELEEKLQMSVLKVELLETMIDIAEDQLKIDIRKKSGSQQSKK
jgi:transposase